MECDTTNECQLIIKSSILIYTLYFTGILAAVWPCGIICAVSEPESLTQVYGILHELVDQNVVKLDSLSK